MQDEQHNTTFTLNRAQQMHTNCTEETINIYTKTPTQHDEQNNPTYTMNKTRQMHTH